MGYPDPVYARKRRLRRALQIIRKYKGTVFGAITILVTLLSGVTIVSFLAYHGARELIPTALSHISIQIIAIVFTIFIAMVGLPVAASALIGFIASKNSTDRNKSDSRKGGEAAADVDRREAKKSNVSKWATCTHSFLGAAVWISVALVMGSSYFLSGKSAWKAFVLLIGLPAIAWFLTSFIAAHYAKIRGSGSSFMKSKEILIAAGVAIVAPLFPVLIFASIIAHRYLETSVNYGLCKQLIVMLFVVTIYGYPNCVFWLVYGSGSGARWWTKSSGWLGAAGWIVLVSLIPIVSFSVFLPTGAWQGLVLRTSGYGGYRVCYRGSGGRPSQGYVLLNLGKQVYVKGTCTQGGNDSSLVPCVKSVHFNDIYWPKNILTSTASRCASPEHSKHR